MNLLRKKKKTLQKMQTKNMRKNKIRALEKMLQNKKTKHIEKTN